jgi:branched-chain amino acid transport system substrate-binding protein
MRSEGLRPLAVLVAAFAFAAGGCGEQQRPFRIGVVVDCMGIARSLEGAELSGAQMPLIARGGRPHGARVRNGLAHTDVAGRRVQLVRGCTEAFEFSTLTRELRRLTEVEHVDAVVAAGTGPDELVMRDVARGHPNVLFVPVVHGPREVTLRETSPNVLRFAADYGQGVAGLATYAYRRLGWRRAAVVLGNWDAGWLSRDAFVAEFCALGGTVTDQVAVDSFDPAGRDVRRVPRDVDGTAVFAGQFFGPAGFIERLARRVGDPARKLIVGPGVVDEPGLLRATGSAIDGVIGSSYVDPARMREHRRVHARTFPGTSMTVAGNELVTGYRDAVEALLHGLELVGGDTDRLPGELAARRVELLDGSIRLNHDRQAVVTTFIVRIADKPGGAAQPVLTPVDTVPGVDQSVGGLLPRTLEPSSRPAGCRRRGHLPPWARR